MGIRCKFRMCLLCSAVRSSVHAGSGSGCPMRCHSTVAPQLPMVTAASGVWPGQQAGSHTAAAGAPPVRRLLGALRRPGLGAWPPCLFVLAPSVGCGGTLVLTLKWRQFSEFYKVVCGGLSPARLSVRMHRRERAEMAGRRAARGNRVFLDILSRTPSDGAPTSLSGSVCP